jgi:hypothetical protein
MKNIAISLSTLLMTFLLIEVFSMLTLSDDERMPFLRVSMERGPVEEGVSLIFDRIDPLLGWSMSEERLRHTGFEVTDGFIVLRSHGESETLRILITGGSTSDLAVLDHNWPVILHEKLEERGIRSVIHVGAVGGYNSGQELLRLIRDGIHLRPHIHISYSGANEADPHFVTIHKRIWFRSLFIPKFPLMPNTQMAIRKLISTGNVVRLVENAAGENSIDTDITSFCLANMRLMNAVTIDS